MDEQKVRAAIQHLIERNDRRIGQLRHENRTELQATKRLANEVTITQFEMAIATLIELEHTLRLCGCPDEAYTVEALKR